MLLTNHHIVELIMELQSGVQTPQQSWGNLKHKGKGQNELGGVDAAFDNILSFLHGPTSAAFKQ